jgi:hypothetical protein
MPVLALLSLALSNHTIGLLLLELAPGTYWTKQLLDKVSPPCL